MGQSHQFYLAIYLASICLLIAYACPPPCECTARGNVTCMDQGLEKVPSGLPKHTTHLNLQRNSITTLSEDDFQGLSELVVLRLDGNLISFVADNVFLPTPKLAFLSLDNNQLEKLSINQLHGADNLRVILLNSNKDLTVEKGTFQHLPALTSIYVSETTFVKSYDFSNMSNLKTLVMSNASITDLSAEYFTGLHGLLQLSLDNNRLQNLDFLTALPNLEFLNVSFNNISFLAMKTFSSNGQLEVIHLSDNRIPKLYPGVFSNLPYIFDVRMDNNLIQTADEAIFRKDLNLTTVSLSLTGNPLDCDCLMRWVPSADVTGTCVRPYYVAGVDLRNMTELRFQCPPNPIKGDQMYYVSMGSSVEIECPIHIDPLFSAAWNTPLANKSITTADDTDYGLTILGDGNLLISYANKNHEGIYRCTLKNEAGELTNGPIFVVVKEPKAGGDVAVWVLSVLLGIVFVLLVISLYFLVRYMLRNRSSNYQSL